MIYEVNQNRLPGIEDTIRATLRAINERNGTNCFAPASQDFAQPGYTSIGSSTGGTQSVDIPSAAVGTAQESPEQSDVSQNQGAPDDACGCQRQYLEDHARCYRDYPLNILGRATCIFRAKERKGQCIHDCAVKGPVEG